MTDDIYKWCCKNPSCRRMNLVEKKDIDEALEQGLKPMLVCSNCGLCYKPTNQGTKSSANYLECIPFDGWEYRLPMGRGSQGTFFDYHGKEISRLEFITRYGVDPDLYLKWRDAGKPKPTHQC